MCYNIYSIKYPGSSVICRDWIVININSNDIREELLKEQKRTLDMCINVCKAMESASAYRVSLKLESVNKVRDMNPKKDGAQSSPRVPAASKVPAAPPPTQIVTDTIEYSQSLTHKLRLICTVNFIRPYSPFSRIHNLCIHQTTQVVWVK